MSQKHTIEFVKSFIKNKGGTLLTEDYQGANKHIFIRCKFDHIWNTTFSEIKNNGHWCPFCAKKVKYTLEQVQQFAISIGYECLSIKYNNNKEHLQFKCNKNHLIGMAFNSLLNGRRCRFCAPERRRQTTFKNWGYNSVLEVPEIQEKIKRSNIKKHGVEYPQQNEDIRQKTFDTNIKKYGSKFVMGNKDIALKCAKSQNNSGCICNWKTNEFLIYVGSFEQVVLEYLNDQKIEFKWQLKDFPPFPMPDGKTYLPDLFLIQENKWIEIKGYKRSKNMKKWEWFHKEYPNSELWDAKKLKELGLWERTREIQKQKRAQQITATPVL